MVVVLVVVVVVVVVKCGEVHTCRQNLLMSSFSSSTSLAESAVLANSGSLNSMHLKPSGAFGAV